jgi:hypothetical protein
MKDLRWMLPMAICLLAVAACIELISRNLMAALLVAAPSMGILFGGAKLRSLAHQGLRSAETRFVIGDRGLVMQIDINHGSSISKSFYKWKSFSKASEIEGALMLLIRSGGSIRIPDQCFEFSEQRAELIKRIEVNS